MVWPFLMGGAAALCAVSMAVGRGQPLKSAALLLAGFLGARVIMESPISSEYRDVVFAAMWVMIAASMPISRGHDLTLTALVKALVFIAALCSLWGRMSAYHMHFGSAPYVVADLMVIAAMLLIGWNLRHDVIVRLDTWVGGNRDLAGGHSHNRSGSGAHVYRHQAAPKAEGQG